MMFYNFISCSHRTLHVTNNMHQNLKLWHVLYGINSVKYFLSKTKFNMGWFNNGN